MVSSLLVLYFVFFPNSTAFFTSVPLWLWAHTAQIFQTCSTLASLATISVVKEATGWHPKACFNKLHIYHILTLTFLHQDILHASYISNKAPEFSNETKTHDTYWICTWNRSPAFSLKAWNLRKITIHTDAQSRHVSGPFFCFVSFRHETVPCQIPKPTKSLPILLTYAAPLINTPYVFAAYPRSREEKVFETLFILLFMGPPRGYQYIIYYGLRFLERPFLPRAKWTWALGHFG